MKGERPLGGGEGERGGRRETGKDKPRVTVPRQAVSVVQPFPFHESQKNLIRQRKESKLIKWQRLADVCPYVTGVVPLLTRPILKQATRYGSTLTGRFDHEECFDDGCAIYGLRWTLLREMIVVAD